ncbi:MAG TPA: type IV pilus twitching motility protein PilT, partial [Thermoanaerobaculia bacterium]
REVTRTRLDGSVIGRLARELAPGGAPEPDDGAWEFDYRVDGRPFHFAGTRSPDGWRFRAEVSPEPSAPAAPAPAHGNGNGNGNGHANGHANGKGTGVGSAHARDVTPLPAPAAPRAAMDHLLEKLVELGGSDLHLSPGQPIRMRIDGDLGPFGTETPGPERTRELLRSITPDARLEEFDADCDADFGYEIPGLARFRVNLFRDRFGMGAVFRQIPETIPSAEDLGLPKPVRELAQLGKGLVLVTGPTGSGKSTTLAAILDLVNRTRPDHVITIEDPIEFVHPSKRAMVNQREVGDHTRSFARALRAALREDPDVVLVGEMRDLETTAIAIETAETGHLVFATLHTTSAIATIERLINQFPAERQEQVRLMLADSLKAVVSQTLLKRIGGGRVAAQEILLCNRAVANLIRENKTYQILSVMQTGRGRGNVTLNEALLRLVAEGTVEPREAYLKAVDKDDLLNRYRTEGIDVGFLDHLDDE